MGYTPAAGLFSAAEVGAPHQRLRIFILAHTDEPASRHGALQPGGEQRLYPQGRGAGTGYPELVDTDSDRRREGWAGPQLWLGRNATPASAGGAGGAMAYTSGAELEGQQRGECDPRRWQIPDGYPALPGRTGLHPPGPGDHAPWATVLAARPDLAPALGFNDCLAWARHIKADPESAGTAQAEPALRRMADGLAHRARALRLLGNGVHPLAAAHAWRALAAAHGLGPVDLATDGGRSPPGADGFP